LHHSLVNKQQGTPSTKAICALCTLKWALSIEHRAFHEKGYTVTEPSRSIRLLAYPSSKSYCLERTLISVDLLALHPEHLQPISKGYSSNTLNNRSVTKKTNQFPLSCEDDLGLKALGIYSILCRCQKLYIYKLIIPLRPGLTNTAVTSDHSAEVDHGRTASAWVIIFSATLAFGPNRSRSRCSP
jgi:hypothetical protein